WQDRPAFLLLAPGERDRVRAEAGELLLLLAGSVALRDGEADLDAALRMNHLSEACYAADQAPRALWAQRAELAARRGDEAEAARLRAVAEAAPSRGAVDDFLQARDEVLRGRFREALGLLKGVVRDDPQHYGAWLLMGHCHLDGLAEESAAAA